jgi:hypothetical protein
MSKFARWAKTATDTARISRDYASSGLRSAGIYRRNADNFTAHGDVKIAELYTAMAECSEDAAKLYLEQAEVADELVKLLNAKGNSEL